MEVMAIVLGVGCLVLAAAAAVLWSQRRRALADAAAAAANAQAATGETQALRAAESQARAEASAARAEGAERARIVAALQQTLAERDADLSAARTRVAELSTLLAAARDPHAAELAHERRLSAETLTTVKREKDAIAARVDELNRQAADTFRSIAAQTIASSSQEFLRLAEARMKSQQEASNADLDRRRDAVDQLVRPIADALRKADDKLTAIEKDRAASVAQLVENMRAVAASNDQLRGAAGRLAESLRKPQVRGRYGEIQLQRVAELAGLRSYCDFATQVTVDASAGDAALRPDMVVRLPNDRFVVVDAKTSIEAFLDAVEAPTDAERDGHLRRFAGHVADHARRLASKGYAEQFDRTPDFVVMFIPGDQFVDAALAADPALFENAARRGVILASPSTLIGLLRAVAAGWREYRFAEQAKELMQLGSELHDRARKAFEHAGELGDALTKTVKRYNDLVGSVDARLMPTLRRFEELGVKAAMDLPELRQITHRPRSDGPRPEVVLPPVVEPLLAEPSSAEPLPAEPAVLSGD